MAKELGLRFDRLRLNGFKSFVDPTDLVIHEGLTGVVGPNGCGKSNLLEALRWVMGENRPTAMRGEGMEDVIFAGTAHRSARAHAEVVLSVDNRARLAPAGFNDDDRFEIVRRITRDAGSAYRIGGRDARARDVQMLFADASTGAHSPALVRQGQIAELIGAKPRARRRILEEAAGISGLWQRRHEAELKLNGAEANLTRVDDTLDQLATQAAALARQARSAARYREIAAALRLAEGALLYRRWSEAEAVRMAAVESLGRAARAVALAETDSAAASARRGQAEAALPDLRDEDRIAAAVLSRLTAERALLDEAEARAARTVAGLRARIAQLLLDLDREEDLNRDAAGVMAGLAAQAADLEAAGQGHDSRLAAAGAAAAEASEALEAIEARLADLTDEAARLAARHQSAERLAADLRALLERSGRACAAAEQALGRAAAAEASAAARLDAAAADRKAVATRADGLEDQLARAEAARALAESHEAATRLPRAEAEAEVAALAAETAALRRVAQRSRTDGRAILEQVTVARARELAFAAAFGDDLRAALAAPGESGWHLLDPWPVPPPLPQGAAPLAPDVAAPPALARKLSQVGLVADAATAAALQPALRPGQRLVTPAGDLFRWDGLRALAGGADTTAALHLQTVNRLAELADQGAEAGARAAAAVGRHDAAQAALSQARAAERSLREARREAERQLSDADRTMMRAQADLTASRGQAAVAGADLARHRADAGEARARLDEAEAARAGLPDQAAAAAALGHARTGVEAARIATLSRRAALAELTREADARSQRLQDIARERSGWTLRLEQADSRARELKARREAAQADLAEAEGQPAALARRRADLRASEAQAEARLTAARAALSAAEAGVRSAALAEREAADAASQAREARAVAEARAESARDAEAAARLRILEDAEATPQALRAALGEDGSAETSAAALDDRIARLRAQRDALGAVNLRADEDRRALDEEREGLAADKADLEQAIRALRSGIGSLNREGRDRLLAAFAAVNANFATLFTTLFGGGEARLELVESDDPLDAGLEILCQPPGKRLSTLSLLSGGEQTLTAMALIFAVFLVNPAPICVLDEVDAPLDDANVSRFCDLLDAMTRRTDTRFLIITHHAVTMSRMDRLFGVTMVEQGVSQLVSVDLKRAEALVA